MANEKNLMSIAERNLALWSQRHQQLNQSAKKIEKHMSNKEYTAKELNAGVMRNDGAGNSS